MTTIRWYGPTLILVATILIVLIAGPSMTRKLAHSYDQEKIHLVRGGLQQSPTLAKLNKAFRGVATVVEPSVVHIEAQSRTGGPDSLLGRLLEESTPDAEEDVGDFRDYDAPRSIGNGSGWVYDSDGHIITNLHVVLNAHRINVRFSDGSETKAKIIGEDEKTDVAVLKVDLKNLHPAARATRPVEQGEIVFAFGSPFKFEFSMSQGIVSATNRRGLGLSQWGGYENFIQTDAAINPGNSGGPLTNVHGEVVGMNTAIATTQRGQLFREASFSGLGFAIPVEMVEYVADQLIQSGQVPRGYLGVFIADLSLAMAQTFHYNGQGVLVDWPSKDGPAFKAGIRRGDIVVKVNRRAIGSIAELRSYVASHAPGSVLQVQAVRDGEVLSFDIKIGKLPENTTTRPKRMMLGGIPTEPAPETLRKLGVETVSVFSLDIAEKAGVEFVPGVIVRSLRRGSVAAATRMIPRQIITHVMGEAVSTPEEVVEALDSHDLMDGVRLSVLQDGQPIYLFLALPQE